MNSYFDDEQTEQQKVDLAKIDLLKREQKIGGLTYSIVVLASLFVNFLYTIVMSAIARKLFPDLPLGDVIGADGTVQEGALSQLRGFQLYRYTSFSVIQVALILVILSIVFFYKRKPVDLGLKKTKPIYILWSLPIFIGLFFGLSWINSLFLRVIQYQSPDIIPYLNGGHFLLATLIIAVIPAIVEEIVFRGIILNGLKGSGRLFACLISGALFALFHMNPAQTIYQFICGTLFAYIAIKANSILPTMLIHFLNNFVALLNHKFNFLGTGNAWIQENSALHIVIIVVSCLLLLFSVGFLIYKDIQAKKGKTAEYEENLKIKKMNFFLYSVTGIIGAINMWVITLLAPLL